MTTADVASQYPVTNQRTFKRKKPTVVFQKGKAEIRDTVQIERE